MKNVYFFLFAFLISVASIAQEGINYKALIKDANGDAITNQAITIRFEIASTSYVYVETHNSTTDANGLIIVNIGEGTVVTGFFNTIDWGGNDYSLGVQVDTGAGYEDLGFTPFKDVPYAKFAEKAGNVKGLETINEGNGIGYRLINQGSDDHQPIGLNAIDLSFEGPSGFFTGASGEGAIAIGVRNHASGDYAMAVNHDTRAGASYSTAIGRFNDGQGNPTTWVPTDPIFEIGNGQDIDFPSNALTVLKNGTITAPSFDIAEITNNKSLITKEYLEANTSIASGLETINEGNGIGWRLVNQGSDDHQPIGLNAIDLSLEGPSGFFTGASGEGAIAIGVRNHASGDYAMAVNHDTRAGASYSTAIGRFNDGQGNPTAWVPTDPIFEIGNGQDIDFPSNALTVLKNGAITAPSFDIAEITADKALITKEYYELTNTQGLESITENGNTGFRLVGKHPAQFGDIGPGAVDISSSFNTIDRGATGSKSFAAGNSTMSSGSSSAAFGFNSEASGNVSAAFGYGSKAEGLGTMAVGNYNIGGGTAASFTPTNPVFEVGCGTGDQARKNALTVLQNGNVGIGKHTGMTGKLEIQSNSTATAPQLALIEDNASFARLKFKNTNRNGDDYWDIAAFIGTTVADDQLNFFNSDGGNIMSLEGDGDVFVNGSLVHASDQRLKRDIETIEYGLADILKLNPVQYNWKDKDDKAYKSLGVLAQEIQTIIPNVVQTGADQNKTLSVSYTELIPVLIQAIQEQQQVIDAQNDKYASLEKMVLALASQVNMNGTTYNDHNVSVEKE